MKSLSIVSPCLMDGYYHKGKSGYKKLLADRKALLPHFVEGLRKVAEKHGERLLHTPHNQISYAISLESICGDDKERVTILGSMLFTRGVSGTRYVCSRSPSRLIR